MIFQEIMRGNGTTSAWKQLSEDGANEFYDVSLAYWHGWEAAEK